MNVPIDFEQRIKQSPWRGRRCVFVRIDDDWGIKCYQLPRTRDNAYEKQLLFFNSDEAPEPGECFKVGTNYCYSTRIAEPLLDEQELECIYSYDYEEYSKVPNYYDEICEVLNRIVDKNLDYRDDHAGNFGWIDGKLVPIDFDLC